MRLTDTGLCKTDFRTDKDGTWLDSVFNEHGACECRMEFIFNVSTNTKLYPFLKSVFLKFDYDCMSHECMDIVDCIRKFHKIGNNIVSFYFLAHNMHREEYADLRKAVYNLVINFMDCDKCNVSLCKIWVDFRNVSE